MSPIKDLHNNEANHTLELEFLQNVMHQGKQV